MELKSYSIMYTKMKLQAESSTLRASGSVVLLDIC